MTPAVKFDVDTTALFRALDIAFEASSKSVGKVLHSAAFRVAVIAQNETPFVEIPTIDAEMEEVVVMGKRSSNKMTRAQSIVLARMNPKSKYNQMTDNRWALQRPTMLKADFERAYGDGGMALRTFWEFVNNAVDRMVSSKHSSTHFLQKGWGDVAKKLRAQFYTSGMVIDVDAQVTEVGDSDLGKVTAGGGQTMQWLAIENLIGTEAAYPNLSADRNRALHQHSGPALQKAVDQTAAELRTRYEPRLQREIAAAFNAVP